MPNLLNNILTANVPTQVTGSFSPILFRRAVFFPYKGFNASGVPIANSSTVYLGNSSGQLAFQVTTGASISHQSQTIEERDNLGSYYFLSPTTGDGLYVIYS